MVSPEKDKKLNGTVVDFSNSGNPVVRRGKWDKKVVIVTDDSADIDERDTVQFVIQSEAGDHYRAVPSGRAPVSKPDYDSSPNIPIHHDGKSVGSSRSESKAMESPDDKEFNPKTHNAPELESEKRSRKFL